MRGRWIMWIAATCAVAPLAAEGISQSAPDTADRSAEVSRRQTAEDLAAKLVERYVFPEVGQKYAAMLRANAAADRKSTRLNSSHRT